jgi:hypothetical protein
MVADVGEYTVGAYLELIKGCEIVMYNVKPPEEGLNGQSELDVLGLDLENSIAYLCEVATHLDGLNYGKGGIKGTLQKIKDKHERQKYYASTYLKQFETHFMFWSPVVHKGKLTRGFLEDGTQVNGLEDIPSLEMFINEDYTREIQKLWDKAIESNKTTGNQFYRTLQLLRSLNGCQISWPKN